MNSLKIAVGGAVAGLLLLVLGMTHGTDYAPPPQPAANQSVLELDQVAGLVPIEESIALWQGRAENHPLDYLSRTHLGAALITQGRDLASFYFTRDPQAALALAEADLVERRDVEAYDTLAWALHLTGRHREASEAIDSALAQGSRSARLLYHAAAIADAVGDVERARTHLAESLALNPHFHPTEAITAARLSDRLSLDA